MSRLFNSEFVNGFNKSFCDIIVKEAYESKEALGGKDLVNLTPCKQLNFFVMKVLFKEWQEEAKKLESPYFNYKNPEVRKAMIQFMNTLSQHIKIKPEDLVVLIDKALIDCFVLIVSPFDFIKNEFKNRDESTYDLKHAKPILKYLKLLTEEFEDFFEVQAKGTYTEVFEIAEDYFADVELIEAQEVLLKELSEISPISMNELVGNREDILSIGDFDDDFGFTEDDQVEKEPSAKEEKPTTDEVEKTEEEPVEVATPVEPEEPEKPEEPEPPKEPETPEKVAEEAPTPTVNEKFEKTEEVPLVERLESEEKPGEGLLGTVTVNHKYMFIQELFDGDANEFQRALKDVESFGSFDESVQHLVTAYAKKFSWDMNSDQVKELLKVIFRYFR